MADRWVINASPVILLAKAGVIQFLPSLCDRVVIPAGVVGEVQRGQMADAGRAWLAGEGSQFVQPSPEVHPALANWRGGSGETEVISWALSNPEFTVVLDDRRARSWAAHHGLPVVGSLRVIVLAKERGLIPKAKPALERLRGIGAYVSDELLDRAIALAGERER